MKKMICLLLLVFICLLACIMLLSCDSNEANKSVVYYSTIGVLIAFLGACGLVIGNYLHNQDYIEIVYVPIYVVSVVLLIIGVPMLFYGEVFA